VNKSDQMLAYYAFQRKSVKWLKKLFFHLFDLELLNIHVLNQMKSNENCWIYKFMKEVAECLVSDAGIETQSSQRKVWLEDFWVEVSMHTELWQEG
jgi:hypothetical protein